MKTLLITFASLLVAASPVLAKPVVMGEGNTYLGDFNNNNYDSNSICNEFGQYGSEFQMNSIFNKFGPNGGEFSRNGAYNPSANKPPVIVDNGRLMGVITKNTRDFKPEFIVDPDYLKNVVCKS